MNDGPATETPPAEPRAPASPARSQLLSGRSRTLAFSFLTTLLFFGVCEGISRRIYPHDCSSAARLERYVETIGYDPAAPRPGSLQRSVPMPFDPYLMWHLIPGFVGQNLGVEVSHDTRGLRTPEVAIPKPSGVKRVLLLGDSTLYGHGVRSEDTVRAQLELRLQSTLPQSPVQVISAGVPGYSSLQSLNQLRRFALEYEPDVVVIANLWSDAMLDQFEDSTVMYGEGWRARWMQLGQGLDELFAPHSAFYCVMKDRVIGVKQKSCPGAPPLCVAPREDRVERFNQVNQPGADTSAMKPRVSLADYRRNLSAMVEICQAHGAQAAILTLGNIRDVGGRDPHHPLPGEYLPYRLVQQELAAHFELPRVDVVPAMQAALQVTPGAGPSRLFMDQVHPTAEGHRVMAEALAEGLLAHPPTRTALEP